MIYSRRSMFRLGKMLADTGILCSAFCLAFVLRFEGALPPEFARAMLIYLPFVVLGKLVVLGAARCFRAPWRFIDLHEAAEIFSWLTVSTLGLFAFVQVSYLLRLNLPVLPVGVLILDLALSFIGMVGARTAIRLFRETKEHRAIAPSTAVRVPTLLVGAGRAGAYVAKEILARPNNDIRLVGFLDDDEHLHGMHVEGVPVLGTTAELGVVAKCHGIRQVIITIAHDQGDAVPRIARLGKDHGLNVKVVPPLHEIVEGKLNLTKLRDVSIEDLLRRSPVQLDMSEIEDMVRNRVVLVTGAGGSIGSELCRIISRLRPTKLVLVEQAENSLFHIHLELVGQHPKLNLVPCIADICDEGRMDAIFREHRPTLVLHAAAHKHVPMMEWNPGEAIKNNVLGTRMLATLADTWGVERFVMISTDKAVNPTSVMGVSKRIAELLVQSGAQKSSTRYMIVRFGNVLGSAGSVIPIFQKQIQQGGPVTVTDPEMKRYFMTIPEACQLVLQAGAMGKGGELFVLDMGEPVKIVDLARDLIRLSGFTEKDIEIRFTGLRPGEKLFEELSLNEEDLLKTTHPRIYIGKVKAPQFGWIRDHVEELGDIATTDGTLSEIYAKLLQIVPEYQCGHLRRDVGVAKPIAGPHDSNMPSMAS